MIIQALNQKLSIPFGYVVALSTHLNNFSFFLTIFILVSIVREQIKSKGPEKIKKQGKQTRQ